MTDDLMPDGSTDANRLSTRDLTILLLGRVHGLHERLGDLASSLDTRFERLEGEVRELAGRTSSLEDDRDTGKAINLYKGKVWQWVSIAAGVAASVAIVVSVLHIH
jgi:hypothetical protein